MKLLYITTRISGAGGVQRVLSVKTDYLIKKGYDVSILVTNADNDVIVYDFNPDISYHTIDPDRGFLKYFISYKKLISDKIAAVDPDIVIVCDNGLKGYLLPFFIKKYPLVYERHLTRYSHQASGKAYFDIVKDKFTTLFAGYAASKFDRFVLLTEEGKKEWTSKNVSVIPNPLWFEADKVSSLDNKVAIAIGRHTHQKGYDRMLDIWSNILQKHPDWKLKIYGKTNQDYDVMAMAIERGVEGSVLFVEPQADIISAYQEASVFLLTSYWEGFGMVLIEAMECGVPCVAFDCPVGPSEIIENGYNGFLIPDGNIEEYTSKVNMVISDKALREKMGKQARQSVSKFEIEPIMNKWIALFNSLK